jgi:nucleoside-diphosphate-sugar epimerase
MLIAVIGCGWLGLPLAISLKESVNNFVATCRSEQKASELTQLGFNAEKFELGNELTHDRLAKLFAAKVLVLNIPVGRKSLKIGNFVQYMQTLLKHAANSQIQNLIFISTTSVYGDITGIVTEHSPAYAQTQSGQINLAVEGLVSEHFAGRSTIIRPAGLVGKERHPAKYLAGKTGLLNPNTVVNLVHQHDVIQSIECVIKNDIWGHTLVLSASEHPTRQDYYTWAAEQLNIPTPSFIEEVGSPDGKLIDASASLAILGMHLKYASPYDML